MVETYILNDPEELEPIRAFVKVEDDAIVEASTALAERWLAKELTDLQEWCKVYGVHMIKEGKYA